VPAANVPLNVVFVTPAITTFCGALIAWVVEVVTVTTLPVRVIAEIAIGSLFAA